jgi:hypothetical protein
MLAKEILLLENLINLLNSNEQIGNNNLRVYLDGLCFSDLKITLMQFDSDYLKTVSKKLKAEDFESYEICLAANEILFERAKYR